MKSWYRRSVKEKSGPPRRSCLDRPAARVDLVLPRGDDEGQQPDGDRDGEQDGEGAREADASGTSPPAPRVARVAVAVTVVSSQSDGCPPTVGGVGRSWSRAEGSARRGPRSYAARWPDRQPGALARDVVGGRGEPDAASLSRSEVGRAPPGDPAPARPGAEAAHPRQQGPAALRRRAVGAARAGGARHVRRAAARARRGRAPVRRAAAHDRGDPRAPRRTSSTGSSTSASTARWPSTRCATASTRWTTTRSPTTSSAASPSARCSTASPSRARSPSTCSTPDDFVLEPLPNHLYTRDTSAWIYGGVSINSMRKKARMRETVHYEAVYRWHPLFADGGFASGRRVRRTARPPPRAATCSSSAAARC